jgi:hypothetical protein
MLQMLTDMFHFETNKKIALVLYQKMHYICRCYEKATYPIFRALMRYGGRRQGAAAPVVPV